MAWSFASSMCARVPAIASTYCAVIVAIPDSRCIKLSATRSADNKPRACPDRNITGTCGSTRVPSGCSIRIVMAGSSCLKASHASVRPAITPACLATTLHLARRFDVTVAAVVMSCLVSSSRSAAATIAVSSLLVSGK